MNNNKTRQVQVIRCKFGAIFAGCIVPECYMDNEWMKYVKKYAIKWNVITFKFQGCTCEKNVPKLF
jgi:hypothetical protein